MANNAHQQPAGSARGRLVFRLAFIVISLVLWSFVVYIGSHVSTNPAILGRWSAPYFTFVLSAAGVAIAGSLIHHKAAFGFLWRFRRPVIALGVGSILAIASAEIGIRVIDPFGISYYESAREYHLDKVPDDELVFRHRPEYKATYGGIEYSFNALGLRDRAVEFKRSSEFRILVLGDSVTLGSGVSAESTFCRKLEASLMSKMSDTPRVINSGVGGYNTAQELAFLIRHGDAIAPDLMLLVYTYNDIEEHDHAFDPDRQFALADKSPPEVLRLLLGRSWIYRVAAHTSRYAGGEADEGVIQRTHKGLRKSIADLQEIAEWAEARSVSLALVFWRPSHDANLDELLWNELSSFSAANRVPLADSDNWFGDGGSMMYRLSQTDSHPNAEGHSRIATGLLQFLEKEGLLPRKEP